MRCAATHEQGNDGVRAATGPLIAGGGDAARRVYRLAERFEEFALEQLQRLEQVLAHCDEILQQENALREMMTSVQEERACWEQQRQKELRRMQDETARLLEAWTRLENEQRRLLAHRPGQPVGLPPRDVVGRASRDEMRPAQPLSVARSVPAEAAVNTAVHDTAAADHVDSAMLQFQQLRRELQKHAQHRQPKKQ